MSTECRLSDKSQAVVTLYITAFITIVSTAVESNHVESFMMAWIAWFPPVRGAAGVVIYAVDIVYHMHVYLRSIVFGDRVRVAQDPSEAGINNPQPLFDRTTEASILTHIAWWIWHVYIPFSQWSWFVEHRRTTNAGIFFARGTAVGVALVGMSFDYKTRVIRAVGVKMGRVAALFMCLLSLIIRLSLLGLMLLELVMAAIKSRHVVLIVLYVIFSIAWGCMSFVFVQGRDDEPDENGIYLNLPVILRLVMGLLFVCLTCTVAFVVYGTSSASNGLSIGAYLKCSPVGRAIGSVLF